MTGNEGDKHPQRHKDGLVGAVGEEKQEEGREGGGILDNRGAFKGHVSKCARNRHGACDINNGGNEKHLSH
ncbi:hypothetical protein Peur_031087 [Populus x canadensis]